jgi:hypothetical protein
MFFHVSSLSRTLKTPLHFLWLSRDLEGSQNASSNISSSRSMCKLTDFESDAKLHYLTAKYWQAASSPAHLINTKTYFDSTWLNKIPVNIRAFGQAQSSNSLFWETNGIWRGSYAIRGESKFMIPNLLRSVLPT